MAPIIEVSHLKYRYPHTTDLVLKDISFTVEKGEFIGIIGENGAGKSTLSQALMGLVPQFYKGAYGGSVLVNGLNAQTEPVSEICKSIGLVFQNPFNQLSGAKETVYDEIAFGLQNIGIEREEMKARIEEALNLLDISQYRSRNPFALSGGQMQRVAIASILIMQPEVMILDEPTSQLDPAGSEEVFRAVDRLVKTGKTIIIIEQKMEKIASYCDRILLMHQGEMIDYDTPQKIFSRPDLRELGIEPPCFTRICKELALQLPNGCYPTTLEETIPLKEALLKTVQGKQENEKAVASSEHIFTIKHMDFSYANKNDIEKKLVIEDCNLCFDLRSTAIIGQNGAGKTTLVKLLKGLLKPLLGNIYYGTDDISKMTVAMLSKEVGYIFQNPDDQIFKSKVLDEVMFGPLNIGMSKEEAKEKAMEALAMVGLENYIHENPYDLELSQRKMIAIASVVAMDTKVIIFDEPTIAQDYAGKEKIKGLIRQLKEKGKLVIAILHDMDFVAESFERVIAMAYGTVLADGTIEEVFSQEEVLQKAKLELPHIAELCHSISLPQTFYTLEDWLKQCRKN